MLRSNDFLPSLEGRLAWSLKPTQFIFKNKQVFILALLLLFSNSFNANAEGIDLQKSVNAVLGVMGFSVVPDVTTGTLSINNTPTSNPQLYLVNFAGGDSLSKDFPLYLEGGIAFSRYNPKSVTGSGETETSYSIKWNSVLLTGGVGWDFPIAKNLVLRPIFNVALGHMESDISIGGRIIESQTGFDLEFLDNGRMNTYGLGGSIMLDYEDNTPEREIDIELRLSDVRLQTFDTPSESISGSSDIISGNIYARWRAPTGHTLLQRPLRYVIEGAHTTYFGDQREVLGFSSLNSIGLGFELDSSAYDVFVSRTRLVGRYMFGHNIRGFTLGLAMSF